MASVSEKESRWYFASEQLQNSPSRKCSIDAETELMYRQRAANLIQDMGQRLHVSQLCINTAIVYMHRFYAFHSFTHFHRNGIASASLFLAAKVEEQPRKLEHVIKVSHMCLGMEPIDPTKETYAEQAQDLVFNENVLLQTLGFDVAIDHPHTHVVKTCHLVKAAKDLAQTSYFMASNSLHLTTMCLQYKPTVVACFCIHLACKWSRWEIPQSTEGKHWFQYVDKSVTMELLQKLTEEFLHIFDRCPSRLKSKMKSISASAQASRPDELKNTSTSSTVSSGSQINKHSDSNPSTSSSSSHHKTHHSSSNSHHNLFRAQPIPPSVGDDHLKTSTTTTTTTQKTGNPSSSSSSSSSNIISKSRSDKSLNQPNSSYVSVSGQSKPVYSSSNRNSMSQKSSSHQYDNTKSHMSSKHRNIQNPQPNSKNEQRSLVKDVNNSKILDEPSNKILEHSSSSHPAIVKQESTTTKSSSKIYGQTQSTNSKLNQQMDLNIDSLIKFQDHDETSRSENLTNSPKLKSSIFSPTTDWKDAAVVAPAIGLFNQNSQSNSINKYGNKDSPKKNQSYYDKKTATPMKKSKSESSGGSSQPKLNSAEKKSTAVPKLDSGSVKRAFTETETVRESKHRKLDTEASLVDNFDIKSNFIGLPLNNSYSNTGNGFETNADLVSNLLKESLCNEKLDSNFTTLNSGLDEISNLNMLGTDSFLKIKKERVENNDLNSESIKIKVKKPKKEKHKHKDRSKDKDDKKKHKKDKERHKNRSPSESNDNEGHIKIKINKDKLSLPSTNHEHDSKSFKIKIPKDRIKTELPSTETTGGNSLKIKISKDILDSYSHNSSDSANLIYNSDKRKDREKSKSSRSEHSNKLNGNLNSTSNSSANQITSNTTKFDFINSI